MTALRLTSCLFLFPMLVTGQSLTDQQILNRVLQTYRTARTYQDAGTVTTTFTLKPQKKADDGLLKRLAKEFLDLPIYKGHTSETRFKTAFQRSTGQFFFTYDEPKNNYKGCYTIVSDGKQTRKWWSVDKSKAQLQESLTFALGRATGVSATASRKIPGLLLTESIGAGWGIEQLKSWRRLNDVKQEGYDFYRFTGVPWSKRTAIFFVDKKTFLIRRIDEYSEIPESKVHAIMRYQPVLNQPISSVTFVMKSACD